MMINPTIQRMTTADMTTMDPTSAVGAPMSTIADHRIVDQPQFRHRRRLDIAAAVDHEHRLVRRENHLDRVNLNLHPQTIAIEPGHDHP